MTLRSGPAVLPLVLLLFAAPPVRAQQEICESRLPPNIDAGQLAPTITKLLARSETFRRQCRRIASTQVLRVRLAILMQPSSSYRALTLLERYEAGALRADVGVVFGRNYVEVLAHEFEHVIEQVDGVNLRLEVASGEARVFGDGAYETRRATRAGLQVLREYEALAPEAGGSRQLRFR